MTNRTNVEQSEVPESELERHLPGWCILIKKLYEEVKREQEQKREKRS
ncbi:MAG: hypothetical protein ACE5KJ_02125 [Candidatus Zixiibacteriota bacterium]